MAKEHILVVDDEEDILELVKYHLQREGFQVSVAASGEKSLEMVRANPPDLILLDLMLPEMDGLEVTRILKNDTKTRDIPIVMLTAKGEEADIVTGLELGADDYITKPFSPRIVVARVRAVARRRMHDSATGNSLIQIHDLSINKKRREVLIKEQPVDLTFTEFEVLYFLARRPGWVFTRSQIVDAVRGDNYSVTDRSVDVQIVGLRKKLGPWGKYIETVRGVGYKFKEIS